MELGMDQMSFLGANLPTPVDGLQGERFPPAFLVSFISAKLHTNFPLKSDTFQTLVLCVDFSWLGFHTQARAQTALHMAEIA